MRRLHQLITNYLQAVSTRLFCGWWVPLIIVFLSVSKFQYLHSQTRAEEVPTYVHVGKEDLPTVQATIKLFPPSVDVNTEDLTIAVATDPQGNVYTLSFGKGVDKRDADGKLLDDNFITGLKNPLDIAIDEEGLIYIADYEASGDTFLDNGQIKIFDPQGNYLRAIWTSFYRPLGIDVDEENIYIAEYNDGKQGPEPNPMSRVEIVDKLTGGVKESNSNIPIPLRIAVNSQKQIYISQGGNNDPAVIVLDQNLNVTGRLSNIISPGSVVIDAFDYVHVIEYAGKIKFSDFINFENLNSTDLKAIGAAIDEGIKNNDFGVKIYSPNNSYQYFLKDEIEFPVDLDFNSCDRMYLDNSGNLGFTLGYPSRLEFDLEIYQRTPSADVTPPVAQCVGDFTIDLAAGEVRNFVAADFNNGSKDQCGEVTFAVNKSSFSEADEGDNIVILTVKDKQGISSTCEVHVQVNVETVTDTEDPVFSCPGDMQFSNDTGECGAVVTFSAPQATDDSGDVTVSQKEGLASGEFFPLGPTEIVFEATDAAGNTAECSFTITVVDDEDPEINVCPSNLSFEIPFGETGRIVEFDQPKAFDHCSAVTVDQIDGFPSGSTFPVGTTTNIYKLSDAAGNFINCSFTVTITELEDTEDPVITCPETVVVSTDPGACGTEVDFELPAVSDNSGEYELIQTAGPEPGSFFEVGDTFVYFEANDKAGNSATCMLKISVVDDINPVANCVSDFKVTLDANGTASITAEDLDNGSTDNCEIVSKTLSKYNFTSADVGVVPVTLTVADASGLSDQCTVQVSC